LEDHTKMKIKKHESANFNGRLQLALVAAGILLGCEKGGSQNGPEPPGPVAPSGEVTEYTNPVFKPILADPTVIKDPGSAYYYAYGTEDYWYTDSKNHLVAVVRSRDLINWSYVADAFTVKPAWKAAGGIWAPDIAIVNGKYHLYYSFSTWGDANPGIGLAISSLPSGPFTDAGKLFLSS